MDIDITGVMLPEFVKEVYNLSSSQGLGMLHFEEGGLTNEEVNEVLDGPDYSSIVVSMDYIKGRACKMAVYKKDDSIYIRYPWFDHTDNALETLLKRVWPKGKPFPIFEHEPHNPSCNCVMCRNKREGDK